MDWFESDDPIDDPQQLVSDWAEARKTNTTGYVPWGVRYKPVDGTEHTWVVFAPDLDFQLTLAALGARGWEMFQVITADDETAHWFRKRLKDARA